MTFALGLLAVLTVYAAIRLSLFIFCRKGNE
jgi:hypothetical protein